MNAKHITRFTLIVMLVLGANAYAECQCSCVNGQMVPLCTNAMEMRPMCPPMMCPIAPPSIAPITQPTLPPLGTSQCQNQQVVNPITNQYEWRQICQ